MTPYELDEIAAALDVLHHDLGIALLDFERRTGKAVFEIQIPLHVAGDQAPPPIVRFFMPQATN